MKYKGKRMSQNRFNQLKKAKENREAKRPVIGVSRQLYELLLKEGETLG